MKTNTYIENFFFALTLTLTISSCGSGDKKSDTPKDSVVTTIETPADQAAGSAETFQNFDWSTVPQSNSEIGAFPYITAPKGFYVQVGDSYTESKTGYSHFKDFNKLII